SIAHVRHDTIAIPFIECLAPAHSNLVSPFPPLVLVPDLPCHMSETATHVTVEHASSLRTGHPNFTPETSPGDVPILPPMPVITTPKDDMHHQILHHVTAQTQIMTQFEARLVWLDQIMVILQ
ncbi:hypothetical protein U1Q18_009422, partial [Sarracenia purpurea var. burkii]